MGARGGPSAGPLPLCSHQDLWPGTHRLPENVVFHCHIHCCICSPPHPLASVPLLIYLPVLPLILTMIPHSIIPWFSCSQAPFVPLCTRVGPLCVRKHRGPPPVSARSQARMREGLEAAAEGSGRLSVPASIWFVRPGSDGHSHPICCWGQAPSAAPPRTSVTLVEGRGVLGRGQGAWQPRCGLR